MPKETFFNLPDEKRDHITNIAIQEFANNEYADVSISGLVTKAGIAKGSFYQYFADKEDLFGYLFDLMIEKKKELFSLDQPDPERMGIFPYMRWFIERAVEFELVYPDLIRIAYRALRADLFPGGFHDRAWQESLAFYKRLLRQGKEQGDVPTELDEDLGAFICSTIFTNLGRYILQRVEERHANWRESDAIFEYHRMPEVVQIYEQTITILEQGLGNSIPRIPSPPTRGAAVKIHKTEPISRADGHGPEVTK